MAADEDLDRAKQQKLQQILHCQKVKPWVKSTGPRTPEGKLRIALNLPYGKGEVNRISRGLIKLDEALSKLQRSKKRAKKRQVIAIEKLEKLAKSPHV